MVIAKDAIQEYLNKELDSFTWMKRLNADRLRREMKSWRVPPEFKTDPWGHQLVCFYIGMAYPQFMFLLDMGLGKTKILLDLFTQQIREKRVKRALITVPRLINLATWEDAILEHSEFEPHVVSGTLEEKEEAILNPKGEIVVIDYPGLQYALSSKSKGKEVKEKGKKWELARDDRKVLKASRLFDFFGMDESHKAKNKETHRWRLLNALTKEMPSRYGSTGTLFGRNPIDIFGQFQLIDGGETFGRTVGMFQAVFFKEVPNYWKAFPDYVFDKSMTRELYRRLQHRSIRYSEDECHDLPECCEIPVMCSFSDEQREHYNRAVNGVIEARGDYRETDSVYLRMRQIIAGYLQWRDEYGEHEVVIHDAPKLGQLERILLDSGDDKVIVSHEYTRTGKLIADRLTALGISYEWLYGGSKDPVNAVRRFMNSSTKVFLMNSESGGTGTDGLQKVAHYLVFYESPSSPITRQQVVKRVKRPGQLHRTFVYDLVMRGSIDLKILSYIKEGRDLHEAIVGGRGVKDLIDFRK